MQTPPHAMSGLIGISRDEDTKPAFRQMGMEGAGTGCRDLSLASAVSHWFSIQNNT